MIPPALPIDEAARLDTLHALKLLDTAPEERFDRLTRLAKRLFGVPVAFIGLVDADRVWFKSSQGLEEAQRPRDVSFCGHAIVADDLLVVVDATLDVRFHDNPLVRGEPQVRFYAGCPLVAADGSRIGTLGLFDRQPRQLDDEERGLLKDLARMVEQEIGALQLATMDELTQLSNRRGFVSLAQRALAVSARAERHTTLFHFEVDGLAAIRERHGAAAGDRLLVDFATLLQRTFRDGDVIGRIGDDAFVVLMTNCPREAALAASQRLQEAVDRHARDGGREAELRFGSGAVAYEPLRHGSVAALLADAEAQMQAAKGGRRAA